MEKPILKLVFRLLVALLLQGAFAIVYTEAQSYDTPITSYAGNLMDHCNNFAAGSTPCEFTDPSPVPYRQYVQYYIPIPPNATFDLAITVVSNTGDIDVKLLGPNLSVLSSSSERIGDDVVQVGRTQLKSAPGNYTLLLQAVAQSMSTYTIRIQATATVTLLAASELALVASIAAKCCSPDDDLLPDSCMRLNAAIAANASDGADLCQQPPNMCDSQGRLTKLVLSGGDKGNFICPSFPTELGNFTQLQVLDWTSNSQVGTMASMAAVLAPLNGTLKRLYMGRNAISGPIDCRLVSQMGLEILRLESNLLQGTLPPCIFQSPTLRYLSLSGNMLRGSIPPVPSGCGLQILDLSANGPPNGPSLSNAGLTGSLPEFSNAAQLTSLDVSSNSLNGTIPALPQGLQLFRATYNNLTGPLPASLVDATDLRVLDVSNNQLSGNLSGEITNNELLTVLRLANNSFGGALPVNSWGDFLVDVDLSNNNFTGALSYLLSRPSIVNLNLANNNLTIDIGKVAQQLVAENAMLYFNISHNNVYGALSEGLGKLRLFNQLLLQASDDDLLQGTMPPQPLFDVSYNLINSTFPTKLLPLLNTLYWSSPYDYLPLSLQLQPQKPPNGLNCPPFSTPLPDNIEYLTELQGLYNLTCRVSSGAQVNVSIYQNAQRPPNKPPRPPMLISPPPLAPPRPPRRRPPPPPDPPSPTTPASPAPAGTSGDGSGKPGSSQPSSSKPGVNDGSGSGGGGSGSNVEGPPPGLPAEGVSAGVESSKKGGSTGAIAGGIAGAVVAVAALGGLGWYMYRRRGARRGNAYDSRSMALTHNTMYDPAPSEGTASNYADMQMFEFRADGRRRARMA